MNESIRLYAIFDRVAGEFLAPFAAGNDGLANRTFRRFLADNAAAVSTFVPDDFQLWFVGSMRLSVDYSKPMFDNSALYVVVVDKDVE